MDKPQTVEVYWQVVGQPELPVHQVKGGILRKQQQKRSRRPEKANKILKSHKGEKHHIFPNKQLQARCPG